MNPNLLGHIDKAIVWWLNNMKNLNMKNLFSQLYVACFASLVFNLPAVATEPQSDCPNTFLKVSVHSQATLCQIFGANKSSSSQSLSYFAPVTPQQLITFYQAAHPQLSFHSQLNQRTLLTMHDEKTRVAISQDTQGTQVDILVL